MGILTNNQGKDIFNNNIGDKNNIKKFIQENERDDRNNRDFLAYIEKQVDKYPRFLKSNK